MRAVSLLFFILTALFAPLPATLVVGFVYAFRYPGLEILFVAACVDALFGVTAVAFGYLYTLGSAAAILAAELVRPFIFTGFSEHDEAI